MPGDSEQIRSFIAIELPQQVKEGLAGVRNKLERTDHKFVKWVDPNGIHLTLKFLGNVPFKRVMEIKEAMEEAVQGISPFRLEICGLGAFPNFKQIRVFWIGVGGDLDKLSTLQRRIDSALDPLGFAPEVHPFVPHLTLARIKESASSADRKTFAELVGSAGFENRYEIEVDGVSLMRSQLTPEGAIYTRLFLVKLRQGH
jgi:2'-5' RNA ligase